MTLIQNRMVRLLDEVARPDTIYRNADDTQRARVFKREGRGTWDFDLFDRKTGDFTNHSSTQAVFFQKKSDALAYLRSEHGITKMIETGANWTE